MHTKTDGSIIHLIHLNFVLNPNHKCNGLLLPPLHHIPLLHNKNSHKQTVTQDKTNPIPKIFPFIFMSLILVCKPFSLTFNSSTFFINATMILFSRLLTTRTCHSKNWHSFLPVTYMGKINTKINTQTKTKPILNIIPYLV